MRKILFSLLLFIFSLIKSEKYEIYKDSGEISFSKILQHQVKNFNSLNISESLKRKSFINVEVLVPKNTNCLKTSTSCQQIRIYGRLGNEPIIQNLQFDKKDDVGSDAGAYMLYGIEYSPCDFDLNKTLNIKIVGIEGKSNYTISVYFSFSETYQILCGKGNIPPISAYPGIVTYQHTTYSFGGKANDMVLNDLYSLDKDLNWNIVQIRKSTKPQARYGHFITVFEEKIIVFGGKNKNEEDLNDLWIYNIENKSWVEIQYQDLIKTYSPRPKFLVSGCLLENTGEIILFGGKSKLEDTNIYLLNLNILNEILDFIDKGNQREPEYINIVSKLWVTKSKLNLISRYGHTITQISDNEVLIFGGFDRNDNAILTSEIVNFDSFAISNIDNTNEERPSSRGFHNIIKVGPILILYGGEQGNKENLNDIWKFNLQLRKWVKINDVKNDKFDLSRSSFSFTKILGNNNPAIYGGKNRNKELISDFILLNFPLCLNDSLIFNSNACLPCPQGYILNKANVCSPCDIGNYQDYTNTGIYSESECRLCPPGTFNNKKAQYGIFSCKICKSQTYNEKEGASVCQECSDSEICPPKTTSLKLTDKYFSERNKKLQYIDIEDNPKLNTSKDPGYWRMYGFYVVLIFSCALLLILYIFSKCYYDQTTHFLINIDFIPITGGTKKKCNGGVITSLYIIIITSLIFSLLIRYKYFNDLVEYLPLSDSNEQSNLKASFIIELELIGHSDCLDLSKTVGKNEYRCSNDIKLSKINAQNTQEVKIPTSCSKTKDGFCKIKFTCENCNSIQHNDRIQVNLEKKDSFVQIYKWQFQSVWEENLDLKRPDGFSKLTGVINPTNDPSLNYVFKGKEPTVVSILLTPYYYNDKDKNKNIGGYRANRKSYQIGSTKNFYNFYSNNVGAVFEFEFYFATNFYEINIKKQIELLDLAIFILGILAGCSFLSRVMKNFMERFRIYDEDNNSFHELIEEKLMKDKELKGENKENLSYPDSSAHFKPNIEANQGGVEMKNR